MIEDNQNLIDPNQINTLIHEPTRLMMMSYLYISLTADLIFFKRKIDATWGNISSHASKLEGAGYIEIIKTFRNKKPLTVLKMTDTGRRAFEEYAKVMKKMFGYQLQTD